ncbi:hypothetical protein OWR29_37655 [Actinoplanes sp. Pm04-4]|uniref:Uncharacterized protein n=1 Tax=Paractinoplanes pyxinae TaxID=2997416 RepID=A0ABT4BDU3_9ACTN|nr:hypothetical protein [Actinoplanes pyxinae]MCY1143760.1 hypothetical protein [Actinoplanes pyxinae]
MASAESSMSPATMWRDLKLTDAQIAERLRTEAAARFCRSA